MRNGLQHSLWLAKMRTHVHGHCVHSQQDLAGGGHWLLLMLMRLQLSATLNPTVLGVMIRMHMPAVHQCMRRLRKAHVPSGGRQMLQDSAGDPSACSRPCQLARADPTRAALQKDLPRARPALVFSNLTVRQVQLTPGLHAYHQHLQTGSPRSVP